MNETLKIRTRTAIIYAIVMIGSICAHRYTALLLCAVIAGGCLYEYTRITRQGSSVWSHTRWYIGLIVFAGVAILPLPYVQPLLILSIVFTVVGIINLYTRRKIILHSQAGTVVSSLYIAIPLGLLVNYLMTVASYDPIFLLSIFGFIWMSDTAAYLVGRQIGKHKLMPTISPNKTWEGTFGAGLGALLLAVVLHYLTDLFSLELWCILGTSIWITGSYGDLVESSIKRQYDIKDSGTFMPGHGGFLDRFDSFIYVIPTVLLLLQYIR